MKKLIAASFTAVFLVILLAGATLPDNDPRDRCSKRLICPPGVFAIPDAPLRSAVEELESATTAYDERNAFASSTNVASLWGASERVSSFLERYQRRSGLEAAVELTPILEPIYKTLVNKLKWIDEMNQPEAWLLSCLEDIRAVQARISAAEEARGAVHSNPLAVTFQK